VATYVVISQNDRDRAVKAIHREFFEER